MLDYRALFESSPGLYLVLTPDLTIVGASRAYLHATMTELGAITGRRIFEVFPDNPEDPTATGVANLRASLERTLQTRRPDVMAVQKYDVRRPDTQGGGFEIRHWSPVNTPVLAADGTVQYIIHAVEDVTEFVRLQALESDQGRRTAVWLNEAARMEAEVYRRSQQLQEANVQLRLLKARLEERLSEQSAGREQAEREREATEAALRRSEEQLHHAQRLESVGRLAGGIAHDFNNLLTVILGYGDALANDATLPVHLRASLDEMVRAGQRAEALTRQLLAFSRQQVMEPNVLDLNEVLRTMERLMSRVLGEDIALQLAMSADLGSVRADRGRLEQVFMNLAVNSRDAMPRGGRLTLETRNLHFDEPYRTEHFNLPAGPYVVVSVSDTGCGMDERTLDRAFEPFFTTKPLGRGTGLGLSTVFGIIKQSDGAVAVHSAPGEGTTFRIYLPRVFAPADAPDPRPRRTIPALGTETVLLVEDDAQVRAVASALLRHAGYHVIDVDRPDRALQIASDPAVPVDLLLTDVIMPQMNGRELADRVLEERPGLSVLFMSGYTADVVLDRGGLDANVRFVEKPFTQESLTQRVREAIDARDAHSA